MTTPSPTEMELKIPVDDLEPVRARLRSAGARRLTEVLREVNVLYDDPDHSLFGRGVALRLRSVGGSWVLTFKGEVHFTGRVKVREELETGVDDGETVAGIFERIGLTPAIRYEKDRQRWQLDEVEVALDRTPLGDFVELEGPAARLEETADRLGLDPGTAVRGSYVSLWREERRRRPELGRDMVFADG